MATAPQKPPTPLPNRQGSTKRSAVIPALRKPTAKFLPPRVVLNAVEGFGKTTAGAHAPQAAIVQAQGETGYETLLGAGLVPEIPLVTIPVQPESGDQETPLYDGWSQLLSFLDSLIAADEIPFKTLVFDALGGFEQLCNASVTHYEFNDIQGEKGFLGWNRGPQLVGQEWRLFLQRLDQIRDRKVMIILLSHCAIRNFKNPLGPDFDRYVSDLNPHTWGSTHKWTDAVLFGTFRSVVDVDPGKSKGKGVGGRTRVIYTERTDGYDAKNRYNMPGTIEIPEDPAQSFEAIWQHIRPNGSE